ncbi:hypothetical protein CEXT_270471 [Caerostris extrusa]|uniref:Uncharacterized protein n=1 Tax=Caerostris extrusa TaxID=172846 RepID=A0AAV4XSP9_CAEEX|nr:hypothetical protein CEXT_270471 [Caerostris extrusa]
MARSIVGEIAANGTKLVVDNGNIPNLREAFAVEEQKHLSNCQTRGNFRAIIEGESGGRSQSNDLVSSPGNPTQENRKGTLPKDINLHHYETICHLGKGSYSKTLMIGMIGETAGSTCPLQTFNDKNYYFPTSTLTEFSPFLACQNSEGFVSVCLLACKENVGSFNISFILGNFRAIIEGDSGGWSQSNGHISSPGNPWRRIGSNATYCAKEICQTSGASCLYLSAACKENVGSFNISVIQSNFRAIIEGDYGGRSQSNDLISSPGNPWQENRKKRWLFLNSMMGMIGETLGTTCPWHTFNDKEINISLSSSPSLNFSPLLVPPHAFPKTLPELFQIFIINISPKSGQNFAKKKTTSTITKTICHLGKGGYFKTLMIGMIGETLGSTCPWQTFNDKKITVSLLTPLAQFFHFSGAVPPFSQNTSQTIPNIYARLKGASA